MITNDATNMPSIPLAPNELALLLAVIAFVRAPNSDGTPCSADREVLARRIERAEYWPEHWR